MQRIHHHIKKFNSIMLLITLKLKEMCIDNRFKGLWIYVALLGMQL